MLEMRIGKLSIMLRSRSFNTTTIRLFSGSTRVFKFTPEQMPSPPKLPKDQQEEFERLQKIANSQAAIDDYNNKMAGNGINTSGDNYGETKTDIGGFSTSYLKTIPEFEGDVNPKTGEKGGPKQDPLKFNDWSFNGRVTDF